MTTMTTNPIAKMHDIFLSYSHDDRELMEKIMADLLQSGVTVWYDGLLQTGSVPEWETAVEKAISEAHCMVVILTPNAKNSIWVRSEIGYASIHEIPIFPVLAMGNPTESIPLSLMQAQRIDLRGSRYELGIQGLINSIRRYLKMPVPTQTSSAAVPTVLPTTSSPEPSPGNAPLKRPNYRVRIVVASGAILLLAIFFLALPGLNPSPQVTPTQQVTSVSTDQLTETAAAHLSETPLIPTAVNTTEPVLVPTLSPSSTAEPAESPSDTPEPTLQPTAAPSDTPAPSAATPPSNTPEPAITVTPSITPIVLELFPSENSLILYVPAQTYLAQLEFEVAENSFSSKKYILTDTFYYLNQINSVTQTDTCFIFYTANTTLTIPDICQNASKPKQRKTLADSFWYDAENFKPRDIVIRRAGSYIDTCPGTNPVCIISWIPPIPTVTPAPSDTPIPTPTITLTPTQTPTLTFTPGITPTAVTMGVIPGMNTEIDLDIVRDSPYFNGQPGNKGSPASWDEANIFCVNLGKRLPTVEEWKLAQANIPNFRILSGIWEWTDDPKQGTNENKQYFLIANNGTTQLAAANNAIYIRVFRCAK